jgi:hypothetical protein
MAGLRPEEYMRFKLTFVPNEGPTFVESVDDFQLTDNQIKLLVKKPKKSELEVVDKMAIFKVIMLHSVQSVDITEV